jgi:HlyD family secretion protein
MTTKKKILIITGIALMAGFGILTVVRHETSPRISVKTTEAIEGTLTREVTATGTLEPINQIEVGTQVSGVIEKIYVDFNAVVKKDQLLAVLDKSMLEAQVAETRARLESAENDLNLQRSNHERYKQLHAKKTISDSDYESAYHAYVKAQTSVDQIKAELTRVERNLGYATITSPIDGVVLSRAVEEGQTVAASFNTPTLFTIANDLTRMRVIADVDEADIGQVKEGQRVTFTVDAFPDDLFNGTVTQVRLNPHVNANVVTYSVVVEAPNPDLKLMPGLTASITVIAEEKQHVVLVPVGAASLKPDVNLMVQYNKAQSGLEGSDDLMPVAKNVSSSTQPSNAVQMFVLHDGVIQSRTVVTGMDDGVQTEIVSGIKAGEQVVIAIETTQTVAVAETTATSSPFLPKPPGSNSKQSTQQKSPQPQPQQP